MKTPGRIRVVVLAALGCAGCAADLGGGLGVEARSGHAVGYGRAASSTKLGTPMNNEGFLIGGSLESRTEAKLGVRYDAALMLGYGHGPAALGGKWGIEGYLELGTPIRGGFLPNGDWLLGATLAVPFHIGDPRKVTDLNGSTWFAKTRLELVPLARVRAHWDHPPGEDPLTRVDLQLGLALRLRVLSDLF
jgi:hypothetical protein